MGEARSCNVEGYLVTDGGPSWCAEIFGESAAYQCCRDETEESGSGLDAQSCPITRESCYNDPVPGDCSWICGDVFSRFSEFKGLDLDNDGVVTIEEMEEPHYSYYYNSGASPAEAQEISWAQREMRRMDRDGDNAISKEEWMHQKEGSGWSHELYEHLVGDRNSWDAHGNEIVLDANGDGFVTIEEIVVILMREGHGSRGPRLKEWAEQEMQWADMDGDNALTKEEWWSPDGCHNDHDHVADDDHESASGDPIWVEPEDFNWCDAGADLNVEVLCSTMLAAGHSCDTKRSDLCENDNPAGAQYNDDTVGASGCSQCAEVFGCSFSCFASCCVSQFATSSAHISTISTWYSAAVCVCRARFPQ